MQEHKKTTKTINAKKKEFFIWKLLAGAFQNFAFRNPLLASVPVFSNSDAKL
jgi:hypothetical protein